MAAIDTSRTVFGSAPVANRVGNTLGKTLSSVISAFSAWNDTRATRKALRALSDRELEDIGLSRGDIDAVAQRTL